MASPARQPSSNDPDPAPPRSPAGDEEWETTAGRMIADSCPYCGVAVAVDGSRELHRQHCHACGRPLQKLRRKKKRREPVGFTSDGLLETRTRERVWMPMTGVALSVVLVAIFGLWMFWRPDTKPAASTAAGSPGALEEIRTLVERFLAARTPEEVVLVIRDPTEFAQPVRDWFVAHPGGLPPGGTLLRTVTKQIGSNHIAEVAVRFDNAREKNLLCVETPAGWRLDWRTYTGLGDMSFPEFIARKPSVPTLLMTVARRSDYYNGAYTNPAVWQCLHIADETGEHIIYAYVPRRNIALMEKIARLETLTSRDTKELHRLSRSLALRVHVSAKASDSDPLQAEVDAVEGEGWFVP